MVRRIIHGQELLQIAPSKSPTGYVSVSTGVAGGKAAQIATLVRKADLARYEATALGRNRAVQASNEMPLTV